MYSTLQSTCSKPEPFSTYTAEDLWTKPHLAHQMLKTHLDQGSPLGSRPIAAVDEFVHAVNQRFGLSGKRICDLGCGPGLYAERFAALGATVTGIDFSPNSILYAQGQSMRMNLEVEYVVADYLTAPLPPEQDIVTLIYCDYCPLSPAQRQTLLTKVRKCLKPGGLFIFDVVTMDAFDEVQAGTRFEPDYMGGFWANDPYFAFHVTHRYEQEAVSLDRYTIIEADQQWEIYNWMQYFSADSIADELFNNDFDTVEIVHGFNGSIDDNATFGVIAKA